MDDVKEAIVAVALLIDEEADEDVLTLTVGELVDRVLLYTNRSSLVDAYENDLADTTLEEEDWEGYSYPIPPLLYTPLARLALKYIENGEGGVATKQVQSMSDNGQTVTFSVSEVDTETLLYDIMPLLNKLIVPTVHDYSQFV